MSRAKDASPKLNILNILRGRRGSLDAQQRAVHSIIIVLGLSATLRDLGINISRVTQRKFQRKDRISFLEDLESVEFAILSPRMDVTENSIAHFWLEVYVILVHENSRVPPLLKLGKT